MPLAVVGKPIWLTGIQIPKYRPARGNPHADVCVVGTGIAGLTTAYLLLREGRSVIVLDEAPLGSGQTGRTSAHLASAIDDRFIEIERQHGMKGSQLAYNSHAVAIDTIEQISRR
jgi:glycine/D-amino acid oxidase-like deaminating enzyme